MQSTTIGSNTFTYTTDDRGSITGMPHLSGLTRDFRDQIAKAVLNGGGDAVYLYESGGQRVRKVVREGASTETRSYIGGAYEVYRKAVSGTQTVERQTLHLHDGHRRVAIVDTLTDHPTVTTPETVQRYQLDNHLGADCVEVNEDAEIISYEEYHPYGTTDWHASEGAADCSILVERDQHTEARHRVVSQWRLENGVAINDTWLPAPDTDDWAQLAIINANPAYAPICHPGYEVWWALTVVPGTVSSWPANLRRQNMP